MLYFLKIRFIYTSLFRAFILVECGRRRDKGSEGTSWRMRYAALYIIVVFILLVSFSPTECTFLSWFFPPFYLFTLLQQIVLRSFSHYISLT